MLATSYYKQMYCTHHIAHLIGFITCMAEKLLLGLLHPLERWGINMMLERLPVCLYLHCLCSIFGNHQVHELFWYEQASYISCGCVSEHSIITGLTGMNHYTSNDPQMSVSVHARLHTFQYEVLLQLHQINPNRYVLKSCLTLCDARYLSGREIRRLGLGRD